MIKNFFSNNLLWKEGKYILLTSLIVVLLGFYIHWSITLVALVWLIFVVYFFRSPVRFSEQALKDPSLIVSPADGKIISIEYIDHEYYTYKISIFLSLFDAHVNWIPSAGLVTSTSYKKGTFVPAFLEKSSYFNEHNDVTLVADYQSSDLDGLSRKNVICVRQIAGMIARRIRCWVKVNDKVYLGQKYGMILFSSRVELFLPSNVFIMASNNHFVKGGQTPLAQWK